jgi:hypothetical protein
MKICKVGALALAAALSSGLFIGQASAMPAYGMATIASKVGNGTQEVRWIGGGWRGVGWRGGGWRGVGWRGVGWRGVGWRGVGWRGIGWRGAGWHGGWGRWAGGRWGWGRGLYAYGGRGWGWGYRRPFLAAATVATGVGLAATAWNSGWYGGGAGYYGNPYYSGGYANAGYYGNPYYSGGGYYGNPYFSGGSYYAYAGPRWGLGWRPGLWGWRRRWR